MRAIVTFHEWYWKDRVEGRVQPLSRYLERFPEHAGRISREYLDLESASVASATGAEGPAEPRPGGDFGPYHVVGELGRGGQGVVYLAEDTRLGRRVALKVLDTHGADVLESVERFRREAQSASRLDHPGLCAVYDTGIAERGLYIALRHVEGQTLSRLLAARGAGWSWDEAARLFEMAARAVHAAHEAGIVHRDLKPGNIMVTPGGEPVVLDFGLVGDRAGDGDPLTLTGQVIGTPAYMAPEQIEPGARRAADARTDVWGLGVCLYEVLSGRRPFAGGTREALYRAVLAEDLPPLRRLAKGLPRDLEAIVLTALEKDPDRRYATALALAEDLGRVRTGGPTSARPLGPVGRGLRWCRREPLLADLP